jgi:segregation and condensation protein B
VSEEGRDPDPQQAQEDHAQADATEPSEELARAEPETNGSSPLRALEAIIFASKGTANAAQIRRALPHLAPARIPDLVSEINEELAREGRPYEIASIAGGYQFRTRVEYAQVILAAKPERKLRLSRPALETLAVIAYRQPLTRAELEELRSVDCGAVLKGLLERSLIRIVGRRDAPGRPVLYGTTPGFLETFGLPSLRDLPTLRELDPVPEAEGTRADEARVTHGLNGAAAGEDDAQAEADGESL